MPVNKPIYISQPTIGLEEWEATKDVFISGWVTQGPKVAEFERNFAEAHKVAYAVATTSCTTGLHLSLAALDIGPGDEVIVPSFTWIATANVVKHLGATPVFADIDLDSFNISVETIRPLVNEKTKAVMPVHLFGLCADVLSIKKEFPNLKIVEDAACATGSKWGEHFAGGMGDAGVFSLHPRKLITTGEGGMVTTQQKHIYDKLIELRNHGASISEEDRHKSSSAFLLPRFKSFGFNYRMTDIQGAVGNPQLLKLDAMIEQRQKFANIYQDKLAHIKWLQLPQIPKHCRMTWQSYVALMDKSNSPCDRDTLLQHLFDKQIHGRPGTHAIPMLDCYREIVNPEDSPNGVTAHNWSVSLPIHNLLTEDEIEYVCDSIIEINK